MQYEKNLVKRSRFFFCFFKQSNITMADLMGGSQTVYSSQVVIFAKTQFIFL
ncbi:hypothetical protein CHCC20488_0813 [Bacillus paralicheniformis]|nr:hypothetical protein CHCC20497_1534 [Bacillus paralicheniformis]TWN41028.1 hypothetical protein CHCC14523_0416 [Bacillus paralicheniformis]TWN81114.1 hypothetical protein CHCC20492_2033 [Bacillus paralicheniformis]TWN96858.1 hypothetical protein CHCC20488_0813 [Bacillus paralicheniformis]